MSVSRKSRHCAYIVVLLEVPDQPGATLEFLLADGTGELRRVALQTADEVVFHSVHGGAFETAVLLTWREISWGGV